MRTQPIESIVLKASLPGSDMRSDMATTPSGRPYSVVDWLNDLNDKNSGPFGDIWDTTEHTLLKLSRMLPKCQLSDDSYSEILDEFCVMTFGQMMRSTIVSNAIIVAKEQTNVMTDFDKVRWMICVLKGDLEVTGYGPDDIPWRYTESEKWRTQQRWKSRPDAELLWERKTELVCREEFQSRIRSHGLPGGDEMWSETAIEDLMQRVAVEECHLKDYLRRQPVAQAVALLSRRTIPEESSSSGDLMSRGDLLGSSEELEPLKVPVLSDKQYLILQSMMELKARSADTRQNADSIAKSCDGKHASASAFKPLLSDLTKRKLTESKTGSGGGSWLTPHGVVVANRLLQNGKASEPKR
jgi:hypothetical protein